MNIYSIRFATSEEVLKWDSKQNPFSFDLDHSLIKFSNKLLYVYYTNRFKPLIGFNGAFYPLLVCETDTFKQQGLSANDLEIVFPEDNIMLIGFVGTSYKEYEKLKSAENETAAVKILTPYLIRTFSDMEDSR